MNTSLLKPLTIPEAYGAWEEAAGYLYESVLDDEPEAFLRNVQARVFAGLSTLWKLQDEKGNIEAYGVTSIYTNDGLQNIAQLYLATGNLNPLLRQMDEFELWAIKNDIAFIEVIGRKGWERTLRPYGFMYNHTSLLKRVNRELH